MNKKDEHLFRAAKEVASRADYSGSNAVKIGCVAVYKGTILAKGCNSDRTHPAQNHYNMYRYKDVGTKYLPAKAHAELTCLWKLRHLEIDFSKLRLYIYREYKNGQLAMARPCPACLAMIRKMHISNVFYTTNEGYCEEKFI